MDEEQVTLAARVTPDPYGNATHQTVGIVDADAILSSVDNDCRHGRTSRLLRSTAFNSTTLYAADHVLEEIYRKLPKIAASSPVPLADLRTRFDTRYLPVMRFITMSPDDEPHPRVLAISHLADRPTGQLALLIAPVIVFSGDKHLKGPGFAPPNWRAAAAHTAAVAEAALQERATGAALILPIAGLWSGSGALGRRLGAPRWLSGTGLVALLSLGAYRLLHDPARGATTKEVGGKFVMAFLGLMAEQSRLKLAGLTGISNIIFAPTPGETSLRQRVAIVLARSSEALLTTEVHQLIVHNFVDEPASTLAEVRNALTDGSEFVSVDRYRWQFGRVAAPSTGQYQYQ